MRRVWPTANFRGQFAILNLKQEHTKESGTD